MKTQQQLREERAAVIDKMTELNETADSEDRDFNDQEQAEYDRLQAQAQALEKRALRARNLEAENRELDAAQPPPDMADPDPGNPGAPEARDRIAVDTPERLKDKKGGFRDLGHFAYQVYTAGPGMANAAEDLREWNGLVEKRSMEQRAAGTPTQSVSTFSDGGALIPPEFAANMLQRSRETSDIVSQATIMPMQAVKLEIPIMMGFDESDGTVAGGVKFYWGKEAAQYTGTKTEVGTVSLNLNKCMGMVFLTDEIMRWSPNLAGPLLTSAFSDGYNRIVTRGAIRGNGSGQMKGILNSPNVLITIPLEAGQAADTIRPENLAKMWARFYSDSESGGGGTWYANKTITRELLFLSVAVGTGGSLVFYNNWTAKPAWSILGDPVRFSHMMSALGTSGDLLLADWSQYLIGIPEGQEGYETEQSIHLKFDYGQLAYRMTFYMDGRPWWPEVHTPENGDTMSPFILRGVA